ncbi:YncE family protein [Nonomuraea typhae]|uniref:YncE family protein n=1 Tax=Nonomuraea typhae TaxID=2603600 RepID=UPI0012F75EAD|nr:hypothetical protein [Nonomuraea typhae]
MRAVLAAVLCLLPAAAPAVAEVRPAKAAIRYAVVQVCKEKACGGLRLVLRGGGTVRVPDRPLVEGWVPIALSAGAVAYFRAKDRRLVIHRLDGRRVVTRVVKGRPGPGADITRLLLSADGTRLSYTSMAGDGPVTVYDARSGARLGRLPDDMDAHLVGFSPDGDQVLMTGQENVRELLVYDVRGRRVVRDVPPQVVGFNLPQAFNSVDQSEAAALSADGRTVAVYVPGRRPRVALYDLESRKVSREVPLAKGFAPTAAAWTEPGAVTFRVDEGKVTRLLRVDLETGQSTVADSYPNGTGGLSGVMTAEEARGGPLTAHRIG